MNLKKVIKNMTELNKHILDKLNEDVKKLEKGIEELKNENTAKDLRRKR